MQVEIGFLLRSQFLAKMIIFPFAKNTDKRKQPRGFRPSLPVTFLFAVLLVSGFSDPIDAQSGSETGRNQQENSSETYHLKIQNVRTQKENEKTSIIVRYQSNVPENTRIRLTLLGTVQTYQIDQLERPSTKQSVTFGPYDRFWPSTYRIEAEIISDNENPPLPETENPVKSTVQFRTNKRVANPFKQKQKFWTRYRRITSNLYYAFIRLYPDLRPALLGRITETHPGTWWNERIQRLKSRIRPVKTTLKELPAPSTTGFPYGSEVKRLKKLSETGTTFFATLFREIFKQQKNSDLEELLDSKFIRRKASDSNDAETLRKNVFVPRLSSTLSYVRHPFRKQLFQLSQSLIELYRKVLTAFRSQVVNGKNRSDWDTIIQDAKSFRENHVRTLDHHLWLFRDRSNQLTKEESKLQKHGIALKRLPIKIQKTASFFQKQSEQTSNQPESSDEQWSNTRRKTIRRLFNNYFALQNVAGHEAFWSAREIYADLEEIQAQLRRQNRITTGKSDHPETALYQADQMVELWKNRWKSILSRLESLYGIKQTEVDAVRGKHVNWKKQGVGTIPSNMYDFLFGLSVPIQKFIKNVRKLAEKLVEFPSSRASDSKTEKTEKPSKATKLNDKIQSLLDEMKSFVQ